jgi:HaeII-like restriction endonuclease
MSNAKSALDSIIKKSRIHLYKPIQIAEILYKYRNNEPGLDLSDLATYRTKSKRWRDDITRAFIDSVSTSSARFQDNLFEPNAIPPSVLVELGKINNQHNGVVEAYVYKEFEGKHFQLNNALNYCIETSVDDFDVPQFVNMFNQESGLKRSVDKIFEIIVYSLFEVLTTTLKVSVDVYSASDEPELIKEFSDFANSVLQLNNDNNFKNSGLAHFHRAGVTNAADRGLDMYSNFGPIVQVKHINLDAGVAEDITHTVTANNIVIVCREVEAKVIQTIFSQIGWGERIQSIITFEQLYQWYEMALRGKFAGILAAPLKQAMEDEIRLEFPAIGGGGFSDFMQARGYNDIDLSLFK